MQSVQEVYSGQGEWFAVFCFSLPLLLSSLFSKEALQVAQLHPMRTDMAQGSNPCYRWLSRDMAQSKAVDYFVDRFLVAEDFSAAGHSKIFKLRGRFFQAVPGAGNCKNPNLPRLVRHPSL